MKKILLAALFFATLAFAIEVPSPKLVLPLNEGNVEALAAKVTLYNQEQMSWVDGPNGKALYLNNKYEDTKHAMLLIPMPEAIRKAQPFTLTIQIKTAPELHRSRQYEIFNGTFKKDNGGFRIYLSWRAFRGIFQNKLQGFTLGPETGKFPQVEPATWYSLAVTFDGKEARIYRDGLILAQMPATLNMEENVKNLCIGATSPSGVCYHFEGAITDFKYFDSALTQEQIALISVKKK